MAYSVTNKFLGLAIVTCLLTGSVFGQSTYPVNPRLDSLRIYVLSQLNIKTTGSQRITISKVDRAINRGYSQTCIDYPAIELVDTITLQRTDEGAALATNFLRLSAAYRMNMTDSSRIPMVISNVAELADKFPTLEDNTDKKTELISPRTCYSYNGRFFTHPKYRGGATSTDTALFLVQYYAMGNPLLAADSAVDVLPEYVEKIIHYACSELSATRQNFDDAAYYLQRYAVGASQRKPREAEIKQ